LGARSKMDVLRTIVSQKKLRYKDGDYNLDLSYITDRIIAMGFPAAGREGIYRNHWKEIRKFLDSLHGHHYRVYNLCSEAEYDTQRFAGRVIRFPFDDHCPPPFGLLQEFCLDAQKWLDTDPENVIAVHCKAGKGRTGTMLSAFLVYCGRCKSASEALRFFAFYRTRDQKAVNNPSQRRYVQYLEDHLNKKNGPLLNPISNLILDRIEMNVVPDVVAREKAADTWMCISRGGKGIYYSRPMDSILIKGSTATFDCDGLIVSNDVHVEFFNKKFTKGLMFDFWFHTQFIADRFLSLTKMDLDKACKDKTEQYFPANFRIDIYFQDVKEVSGSVPRRRSNALGLVGTAKMRLGKDTKLLDQLKDGETSSSSANLDSPEQFHSQFPCGVCKGLIDIRSDQNVYTSKGQYYHWNCLKCSKCSQRVESDFLVIHDQLVCLKCDKTFFDKCHYCKQPLKTNHVSQEGHLWHPVCYTTYYLKQQENKENWEPVKLKVESTAMDDYEDNLVPSNQTNYNFMTLIDDSQEESAMKILNEELNKEATSEQNLESEDAIFEELNENPTYPAYQRCSSLDGLFSQFQLEQNKQQEEIARQSLVETNPEQQLVNENKNGQICQICQKLIGFSLTYVLDNSWIHQDCYRCNVCQVNNKPIIFKEKKLYCQDHFAEFFGPKCFVCRKTVIGELFEFTFGSTHTHCIKCHICHIGFTKERPIEHIGLVYCQKDYEDRFLPHCFTCKLVVVGSCLTVFEKNYHPNCLICANCSKVLPADRIFVDEKKRTLCGDCN